MIKKITLKNYVIFRKILSCNNFGVELNVIMVLKVSHLCLHCHEWQENIVRLYSVERYTRYFNVNLVIFIVTEIVVNA